MLVAEADDQVTGLHVGEAVEFGAGGAEACVEVADGGGLRLSDQAVVGHGATAPHALQV